MQRAPGAASRTLSFLEDPFPPHRDSLQVLQEDLLSVQSGPSFFLFPIRTACLGSALLWTVQSERQYLQLNLVPVVPAIVRAHGVAWKKLAFVQMPHCSGEGCQCVKHRMKSNL